jgi:hypothetical protein
MNSLTPDQIRPLLERIYDADDGVVRSLNLVFRYRSQPVTTLSIVLSVQDQQTEANDKWVNLHLRLEDVREFAFNESPRASYQVLSDELRIGYFNELYFLDFGGSVNEPTVVEDYRRSKFYAAARSIMWEIVPFHE